MESTEASLEEQDTTSYVWSAHYDDEGRIYYYNR